MKHFRAKNGEVFAFEQDGTQDHLILDSMTEMTVGEVGEHIDPAPTAEELAEQSKHAGFDYKGIAVPVTNADAAGVLQMEAGFERYGMESTNFHMSNGEALPLTLTEWPAFAAAFFAKRASFF